MQELPYITDTNTPLYATKKRRLDMYAEGVITAYMLRTDFTECQIRHCLSADMEPVLGTPGLFACYDKRRVEEELLIIAYYYAPKGVLIDSYTYSGGYDLEFILTPLKEKPLYVYPTGYKKCLPNIPSVYRTTKPTSSFVEIEVPDHIIDMADLFANLHWFNFVGNKYVYLSEEDANANLTRHRKQNFIFNEVGNDGSRIADYGRLIHLLIHQLYPMMTEEAKITLLPFITSTEYNLNTIDKILSRELKIQEILKDVSND